jgi:hypothetical protein
LDSCLVGECSNVDGLFYVDQHSFAFCSNGQKTIQACAAGSANPPLETFKLGGYYNVYEFCSDNLVARGYYTLTPYYPPIAPAYAREATEGSMESVEKMESYQSQENSAGYTEEVHGEEQYQFPTPELTP